MSVPWGQEVQLFDELFRYAIFLRGDRPQAMQALRVAVQKLQRKPEATERERGVRFLFTHLRRQKSGPASSAPSGATTPQASVLPLLQKLSEPDRSLAGLFYLTSLSASEMARLLGLSPAEMARRMHTLRLQLAPALHLLPPKGKARAETPLERPLQGNKASSTFQAMFDRHVLEELALLAPTPGELEELTQLSQTLEARTQTWKPTLKDPGLLGLASALLLLLGVVGLVWWGNDQKFLGQEKVQTLLLHGTEVSAQEFAPVQAPLAELGDWLALQGLEGFWVPSGFAQQETLAARTFSWEGARVVSILLPQPRLVVYLFDAQEMGLSVQPDETWHFFAAGKDAGAITRKGRICFMVAYRGSPEELKDLLQSLLPQS